MTDKDSQLAQVRQLVQFGSTEKCPSPELKSYFNRRQELSVLAGCIVWGSRVVVPPQGWEALLAQVHDTHPGIVKMKNLARSYYWWPGLDSAIEAKVNSSVCQKDRPTPQKVTIHSWEWPHHPWSRLYILTTQDHV